MAGRGNMDPELLGRIAERMEETGRSLRTISDHVSELQRAQSSSDAQRTGSNARLKKVEEILSGSSDGRGLRGEVADMKSNLKNLSDDVEKISSWIDQSKDKRVNDLEEKAKELQKSDEKKSTKTLTIVLWSLGTLIAVGGLIGSCGAMWFKALSPAPVVKTQKTSGGK